MFSLRQSDPTRPLRLWMGRSHISHAVSILLAVHTCLTLIRGCVILELVGHGFASNINALFSALPAYNGFNGTIFLDNYFFAYKCTDEGGLHEFFATEPGDGTCIIDTHYLQMHCQGISWRVLQTSWCHGRLLWTSWAAGLWIGRVSRSWQMLSSATGMHATIQG